MNLSYVTNLQFYKLLVILFSLSFFPSFFYVVLNITSTALGLFFAVVLVFMFVLTKQLRLSNRLLTAFFAMFFFLYLYNIALFGIGGYPIDNRVVFSSYFFVFMVFVAYSFAEYLLRSDDGLFVKSLFVISFIAVVLGVYSYSIDQNFLGYKRYVKSVFPFAEPSHYAITMGPILFGSGFLFSLKWRIAFVFFSLIFAILSPSLIMLLFSLLMILFFFKWNIVKVGLLFPLVLMSIYLIFTSDQGAYFIERLSFSETTNLTALVYLQGWSDMVMALQYSNMLGIGFQNLGVLNPSYYGELIYSLAGEYKNRNDGGFLASKIISELGMVGVFFIILYFIFFIRSSLFLIRFVRKGGGYPSVFILSNALIVSFSVELFARGYGYFSPGFFLFIASFFVVYRYRRVLWQDYYFEQK